MYLCDMLSKHAYTLTNYTHTHAYTQALFLCMDYLENFVGSIPGFYSICLCCTIYLMLPLFRGAEQVDACIL